MSNCSGAAFSKLPGFCCRLFLTEAPSPLIESNLASNITRSSGSAATRALAACAAPSEAQSDSRIYFKDMLLWSGPARPRRANWTGGKNWPGIYIYRATVYRTRFFIRIRIPADFFQISGNIVSISKKFENSRNQTVHQHFSTRFGEIRIPRKSDQNRCKIH